MQGDMFFLSDSRSVRMLKISGTWRHARLGLCAFTTSYKRDDDTAENAHHAYIPLQARGICSADIVGRLNSIPLFTSRYKNIIIQFVVK